MTAPSNTGGVRTITRTDHDCGHYVTKGDGCCCCPPPTPVATATDTTGVA